MRNAMAAKEGKAMTQVVCVVKDAHLSYIQEPKIYLRG